MLNWVIRAITLMLLLVSYTGNADPNNQQKLEYLESQILHLKHSLQRQKSHQNDILSQLKHSELAIAKLNRQLEISQQTLNEKKQRIEKLKSAQHQLAQQLSNQRIQLTKQLTAYYRLGNKNGATLLLNQSDPNEYNRAINYLTSLTKSRIANITMLRNSLQKLQETQSHLSSEQQQYTKLITQQSAKQNDLKHAKNLQNATLKKLKKQIKRKSNKLNSLHADRRALESVIAALETSTIQTKQAPQKKVAWQHASLPQPCSGTILRHYGASIEHSGLKARGILIKSLANSPVHAVYQGKIVFSDWLRGYGLLTIIDHGNGYMSLYGHNSQLYKNIGDVVHQGDTIARVGTTGGESQAGLYFALRYQGRPVNPSQWLKKKA